MIGPRPTLSFASIRIFIRTASIAACAFYIYPAHAQWNEYEFPELGFAIQFPGAPQRAETIYETPVIGFPAQAAVFSLEHDGVIYRATVVALENRAAPAGASIMGECAANAEEGGKLIASRGLRVGTLRKGRAEHSVFGRAATVERKDGTRVLTECFVTLGRLYKIEAESKSQGNTPGSSYPVRFVNSVRFDLHLPPDTEP
jgi:hypothetical protein